MILLYIIFSCNALKPTIHHVQEHTCGKKKKEEKLGLLSLLPQGKVCPKELWEHLHEWIWKDFPEDLDL